MKTTQFPSLPDSAKHIREVVFVNEQGFEQEFDELDNISTHLVTFDNAVPIATCRVWLAEDGYHVGRLAVIKEKRGQGVGQGLLKKAETLVRVLGGSCISLHAQCRAEAFYRKCGYEPFGNIDYDEGVEHVHMRKFLD